MPEFRGNVSYIAGVDDPSWSGCVARIELADQNYIHVFTATQGSLFETAFALNKPVSVLADPAGPPPETPIVVWNNVTNLNLYKLFRVTVQQ